LTLFESHKMLITDTLSYKPLNIEPIFGGLVHYCYHVNTPNNSYVAKIRANKFAKLEIQSFPEDIEYELESIRYHHQYFPQVFPEIIESDSNKGIIIMSNLLLRGNKLSDFYKNTPIQLPLLFRTASLLGSIHNQTNYAEIKSCYLPFFESQFKNNLIYKFGFTTKSKFLYTLKETLSKDEKGLLIGDRSPKNIGFVNHEIKFFDLELTSVGSYNLELGMLLAHFILLSINTMVDIESLLEKCIVEYLKYNSKYKLEKTILASTILGILYYRIFSPVVKFNHGLPIIIIKKIEKIALCEKGCLVGFQELNRALRNE